MATAPPSIPPIVFPLKRSYFAKGHKKHSMSHSLTTCKGHTEKAHCKVMNMLWTEDDSCCVTPPTAPPPHAVLPLPLPLPHMLCYPSHCPSPTCCVTPPTAPPPHAVLPLPLPLPHMLCYPCHCPSPSCRPPAAIAVDTW